MTPEHARQEAGGVLLEGYKLVITLLDTRSQW